MNRKPWLLISVLLLAAVLLAACEPGDPFRSTGAYPIEIFPEMHYSPAFRGQEPPRLHPPEGSIPVSGSQLPVGDREQEADRPNPLSPSPEVIEYGALLYQRDCAMCHGVNSAGDEARTGTTFAQYSGVTPPPIGGDRIQDLTPGQTLYALTHGFGLMPPFGSLLTEEERWYIITMIEAPEGEREPALSAAHELTSEQRGLRLLELRNQ